LPEPLSFQETTILSAWKKSGISPLSPEVFMQWDFGPSITTSIKPLFLAPFQSLLENSLEYGAEEDEDEDGDEDMIIVSNGWSPESSCLNCGVETSDVGASKDLGRCNNLPILAQAVTNHIPQDVSLLEPSPPSESSIPPPSAPLLIQLTPDVPAPHCFPSEEGGEPPGQPGDQCHCAETSPFLPTPIPHVSPHQTHSLSHSASQSVAQSSAKLQPDWSKSVEEQLADVEQRNEELKCEINELKTHCYFTGNSVKQLQKQVNTKQTWKGSSICAKNINVDARVLTSEEGCCELQQLQEEVAEKE
jgi:hypothetical protein